MDIKTREENARRRLKKHDLLLRKSRTKNPNADDLGGYMIASRSENSPTEFWVAGERYSLNLDGVEDFIYELTSNTAHK